MNAHDFATTSLVGYAPPDLYEFGIRVISRSGQIYGNDGFHVGWKLCEDRLINLQAKFYIVTDIFPRQTGRLLENKR